MSEGTIYPLLSRLQREGLVTSQWRESPAGPPRKYYSLTSQGRQVLESKALAWEQFSRAVNWILEEAAMANISSERIEEEYLQRLRSMLRRAPANIREDAVRVVQSHIADEWQALGVGLPALHTVLQRLGPPEEYGRPHPVAA